MQKQFSIEQSVFVINGAGIARYPYQRNELQYFNTSQKLAQIVHRI